MILPFAFHIIITTLMMIWPFLHPQVSAQNTGSVTQPGCNSACGDVQIPYPFGMKNPKCYANTWFEIDCRNTSSGQTPYLKSLNLQVTNIDASQSTIGIMNPIFRWNCKGTKNSNPSINLQGSPFVYSQNYDQFLAVGCNNLALLLSDGSTVGGCVSLCDDNDDDQKSNNGNLRNFGCHGRYCCETSLPLYLSEYNVTLQNMRNESVNPQCGYAAIVIDGSFGQRYIPNSYYYYNEISRLIDELKSKDYVEAVLEWEMQSGINNSTMQLSSDANCYDINITLSSVNRTTSGGKRCECNLGFDGNPYIAGGCIALPSFYYETRRSRAIVGVMSSLASIIFLLGLWWLYKVVRKRMIKKRKEKFFKRNGGLLLQQRMSSGEVNVEKTILFSLNDLEKATDNFNVNRVLGKGGQGTVYKGMLVDGKIVAVKKFKVEGKVDEFINEFVILSQINHRNVVKLLGCCLETEIPLLVYEFIPNGNLYEYLHDESEELPMTWDMHLRIAAEIAGSLFYLHSLASQPIYHRDIKSTNILLDEKYKAKLADFGASRTISIEATHLTTVVRGTFGYLDPEYFHTSQFTEKSDVYSFGVVLVELLTGKKPIFTVRSGEAQNLASYFVQCMEENSLFDIVDKRVTNEAEKEHIIAIANLAIRCLDLNGKKRPTMKEVTLELEGIRGKDKNSNAHQNYEEMKEIEVAGIEDDQSWAGYSMSSSIISM